MDPVPHLHRASFPSVMVLYKRYLNHCNCTCPVTGIFLSPPEAAFLPPEELTPQFEQPGGCLVSKDDLPAARSKARGPIPG